MKIFHAITGADAQAFSLFPDRSKNILIAASMMMFEKGWRKHHDLIHQKKNLLFADSGLIGWIKSDKFCKTAFTEYACQPERVLNIQTQINADIYAALDVPCEDFILKRAGVSIDQAIEQTVKNAEYLRNVQMLGKIKCFPVQGYKPEEYYYCVSEYKRIGLFDLDPAFSWFAVGSTCMRKPSTGLYEINELVRNLIPQQYHLHCFGIANPPWIINLAKLGINSCDSATASISAGLDFAFIDEGGKRLKLQLRNRNKFMSLAQFAFNMASIEYQVEIGISDKIKPIKWTWENEPLGRLSKL